MGSEGERPSARAVGARTGTERLAGERPGSARTLLAVGAAGTVLLAMALAVAGLRSGAAEPARAQVASADTGEPAAPAPRPTTELPVPAPAAPGAPAGPAAPPARTAGTPVSQTRTAVPTRVVLPDGAVVPVDRADLDAAQALALPPDPARAGWWTGGARVGEPFGSVVVAGHIDSRRYGVGPLAALRDVRPGEVVGAGDGDLTVRYRIESVQQIPKADLGRDSLLFDQARPHRLVLITCDGEFDESLRRYADNLVVTAVPVP